MDIRAVVEALTITTMGELRGREPGRYVDLEDHPGGRATEADIHARDTMRNLSRHLRPRAMFVSEDSNRPADIEYPDPSQPAEVLLADPCDGSRQFGQLGFAFASCVSHHHYDPDSWWKLDAASMTVSSGNTTSSGPDGQIMGSGGNTDDSVDLRDHTTRAQVRIPPCVAVGASSPSGIPLLTELMEVADPEVPPGTAGEDHFLRVWNTAGNPITPGLLRSHTMVAVQLGWSTQWDTQFAYFGSLSGLEVYPLVWTPRGAERPLDESGRPQGINSFERRLWWGRPRWAPFERTCIPPLVVGPREPYTHEVFRIIQSSDYFERAWSNDDHIEQFESAMRHDTEQLLAALHRHRRQWD